VRPVHLTVSWDSNLTRAVLTGDLGDLRDLEARRGEDVVVLTKEEWAEVERLRAADASHARLVDQVTETVGRMIDDYEVPDGR